jgi:hypothetical protein
MPDLEEVFPSFQGLWQGRASGWRGNSPRMARKPVCSVHAGSVGGEAIRQRGEGGRFSWFFKKKRFWALTEKKKSIYCMCALDH